MRFVALDSWRGLAALFIAALHFNVATHGYDAALWRFAPLAVDFFFVLSGFVISYAYARMLVTPRHAAGFLIRRFGRLWPLHAAVLSCFVAVELAKAGAAAAGLPIHTEPFADSGPTSLSHLVQHIFLLHGTGLSDRLAWNAPSWSISAEFWVYVIFAYLAVAMNWQAPYRWRGTAGLVVLGLVSAMLLAFAVDRHDLDLTHDFGLVRCLLGFAVGHAVYFLQCLGLRGNASPAWKTFREISILAVIAIVWTLVTGTRAIVVMPFLFGIMVAFYSIRGGRVSTYLERPALQALGRWSYSIYMVHGLLLYILSQAVSLAEGKLHVPMRQTMERGGREVPTVVLDNLLLGDVALVIYLALVIILSAATYRWIEAPARRAFNDLGQRVGGFPAMRRVSPAPAPSRVGLQAGRR